MLMEAASLAGLPFGIPIMLTEAASLAGLPFGMVASREP